MLRFRHTAWGNLIVLAGPMIIAFVTAMSFQPRSDTLSFYLGIGLMIVGWFVLVASKWDQVSKGDFWTFGVSKDKPKMRVLYVLSYFVMVFGWLMACLVSH